MLEQMAAKGGRKVIYNTYCYFSKKVSGNVVSLYGLGLLVVVKLAIGRSEKPLALTAQIMNE